MSNIIIYDLSNYRFQYIELTTKDNRVLNGQFVNFYVVTENKQYIYPSGKLCFLPETNKNEFWEYCNANRSTFSDFPAYILEFSLNEIAKIVISPIVE